MVASDHDRKGTLAGDLGDTIGELRRDPDDLGHVVRTIAPARKVALVHRSVLLLGAPLVAIRDADVAALVDAVAEIDETIAKAGIADRGGSHVYTTPVSTEVHRDADDRDVLHWAFDFG